jgi:hypothetical protein
VKDSSLNLRFCSPVHNTVRATRKSEKEEEETVVGVRVKVRFSSPTRQ